jgi:hypothetical protein
VRIQILTRSKWPFQFEQVTRRLLRYVPSEHIAGLEELRIVDGQDGEKSTFRGLYYKRHQGIPAHCVLNASTIFERTPRWLFYITPAISTYNFAQVLYHEIGHHHQHNVHGITKQQQESFAKRYSNDMCRKAFHFWYISGRIIFFPLAVLARVIVGLLERYYSYKIKKNPQSSGSRYRLASVLMISKKLHEANKHLHKAVQLQPNFVRAWYQLGKSYTEIGDYDNATESFERVTLIDPRHANAHFSLGSIYRAKGNMKKATQMWEKTLEVDSNHRLARNALSKLL